MWPYVVYVLPIWPVPWRFGPMWLYLFAPPPFRRYLPLFGSRPLYFFIFLAPFRFIWFTSSLFGKSLGRLALFGFIWLYLALFGLFG